MTFKDIRENYSLFLFDRDKCESTVVTVSSVGAPRFESKPGQMPQTVVDITVDVDGKPVTYPFPDSMSKAYMGNVLVSVSRSDIIDEVRSVMAASERAIAEVQRHRDCVDKCRAMLTDLDVEYRDKRRTEERFTKIEESLSEMKEMMASIARDMSR